MSYRAFAGLSASGGGAEAAELGGPVPVGGGPEVLLGGDRAGLAGRGDRPRGVVAEPVIAGDAAGRPQRGVLGDDGGRRVGGADGDRGDGGGDGQPARDVGVAPVEEDRAGRAAGHADRDRGVEVIGGRAVVGDGGGDGAGIDVD